MKKKRELVNLKFQAQVQQMHYSSRECCIAVTSDLLLFSCSVMSNSLQLWPHGLQASLPFTISPCLLRLMSIELVMPSNHLVLCRPLLLLSWIFPIRVFSNESAPCIRWPEYWSFSLSPSNEYSELISFRVDWFDLLTSATRVTS